MSFVFKFDVPAQNWIDAGLAIRTEKGKDSDLTTVKFAEAQANNLVHLTGKGALALDLEAKRHQPPSPT